MTSLNDIQRVTKEIPDAEFRDACVRLANALWERSGDKSTMWTYKALSNLLGVKPNDPVLHRCIELLASRPNAKLLDMHFLYFDPNDAESPGEVVEDEAVSSAYKCGYLIDPVDGREVHDFEKSLVPYFLISKEVKVHGTDR